MDNETAYVAHELGKAEEYIKDLESKLAVAVEVLEVISKNCYGRPTEMMVKAREFLSKLEASKGAFSL